MEAIKRSDHTQVIRGEREEDGEIVLKGVGDLSVRLADSPWGQCFTSHWKPNDDDLAVLNAGGVIELDVVGRQLQPVLVSVAWPEAEGVQEGLVEEQTCTHCGKAFPIPVELHHNELECERLQQEKAGKG